MSLLANRMASAFKLVVRHEASCPVCVSGQSCPRQEKLVTEAFALGVRHGLIQREVATQGRP